MKVEPKALAFKDAISFWESKVKLSPSAYQRLSDEAKMRAFAVSGIAKTSELETVYNALSQAVAGDIGFEDFKARCQTIFDKRGWTGVKAWRVDNIFRTNIQSAYMAGRWNQVKAAVKTRPFGQYSAVNDKRTRPTHSALHGEVYPLDHSFWNIWWPPNGFRCRCTVKTLSQRQVDKQGLTVRKTDITGHLVEPRDPATGKALPARPLMPDPGFMFHPGKSAFGGITPGEGAGAMTDIGLRTFEKYGRRKLDNLPASAFLKYHESDLLETAQTYMARTGAKRADAQQYFLSAFMKEFGGKAGETMVYKDVMDEALIISSELFTSAAGRLKITKKGREQYLRLLARAIKDPYEIWLVPQKTATGKVIIRRRYIAAFSNGPDDKITGFVAFDYGLSGWNGVTAFPPDKLGYADGLRNGALVYKR